MRRRQTGFRTGLHYNQLMSIKTRHNRKEPVPRKRSVRLSLMAAASVAAFPGFLPDLAQAQAIDCVQPILFGSVVPCTAAAGTVTVNPDDSTSSSPGCMSVVGTQLKGRCLVTGSFFPVMVMDVSVTNPTTVITSGGNNMNVTNANLQTPGGGPTTSISAYLTTVAVGATLNVGANQAGGSYSGNYTLSVNYQ